MNIVFLWIWKKNSGVAVHIRSNVTWVFHLLICVSSKRDENLTLHWSHTELTSNFHHVCILTKINARKTHVTLLRICSKRLYSYAVWNYLIENVTLSDRRKLVQSKIIEYRPKIISLTYKRLRPSYLCTLKSLRLLGPRCTRSSSLVILARPPSHSTLKITDRSFRYASPHLWTHPGSFRHPCPHLPLPLSSHNQFFFQFSEFVRFLISVIFLLS